MFRKYLDKFFAWATKSVEANADSQKNGIDHFERVVYMCSTLPPKKVADLLLGYALEESRYWEKPSKHLSGIIVEIGDVDVNTVANKIISTGMSGDHRSVDFDFQLVNQAIVDLLEEKHHRFRLEALPLVKEAFAENTSVYVSLSREGHASKINLVVKSEIPLIADGVISFIHFDAFKAYEKLRRSEWGLDFLPQRGIYLPKFKL